MRPALEPATIPEDPVDWCWPPCPTTMRVYDKYADKEGVLRLGVGEWEIPVQGLKETFRFQTLDPATALQQRLVFLTQGENSPSSIVKFTRSMLKSWDRYVALLVGGPDELKRQWRREVSNVDVAKAGKAILKLACSAAVGRWSPEHLPMVKGLDGYSKADLLKQQRRIKRREKVLPVDVQAGVTRVLDEGGQIDGLTEAEAEGLAALALIFQHGVRPVQVLALHTSHLRVVQAADAPAAIVSFHAAKRQDGDTVEMPRQVKPEWVGPVLQLREHALRSGRKRLFSVSGAAKLWANVKAACRKAGHRIWFTANLLRHTSAQSLADAGQSRESIRKFLGQKNLNAAISYLRASRRQGTLINRALGASKLYGNVLALATAKFVSVEEMLAAPEDQQIAGVVGDRLVAGIGLCKTGQPSCPVNPVTSCYGCGKFIPSLVRDIHVEAVAGMRAEIRTYLEADPEQKTPGSFQLMKSLAGAQQTLALIDGKETNP